MTGQQTGTPASVAPVDFVATQIDAMSQHVNKDRDQRCAQIRTGVEAQARDILRLARKDARAKVREAVVVTRKLAAQALLQTRAKAWLEQQQLAQQQSQSLLKEMWSAITGALELRWADPAHRKDWTQSAIHQARMLLSGRTWSISHGAGWSEEELDEMRTFARGNEDAREARVVDLVCKPEIRAGITIRTPGAALNATVTGLLSSRSEVESEFLARYLARSTAAENPAHE